MSEKICWELRFSKSIQEKLSNPTKRYLLWTQKNKKSPRSTARLRRSIRQTRNLPSLSKSYRQATIKRKISRQTQSYKALSSLSTAMPIIKPKWSVIQSIAHPFGRKSFMVLPHKPIEFSSRSGKKIKSNKINSRDLHCSKFRKLWAIRRITKSSLIRRNVEP